MRFEHGAFLLRCLCFCTTAGSCLLMSLQMAKSVLSHVPTCESLHKYHLQHAKGDGHYGKENEQKPAFGVLAAVHASCGLSAEKWRMCLGSEHRIAHCLGCSSLPSCSGNKKMQVNFELMGMFHSLFTQESALSQEPLSI